MKNLPTGSNVKFTDPPSLGAERSLVRFEFNGALRAGFRTAQAIAVGRVQYLPPGLAEGALRSARLDCVLHRVLLRKSQHSEHRERR